MCPFQVQSNVVTTEHDYVKKNGTHQDSLLNPKNKKYLADMMMNIRIAACGGGTARLTVPSVHARMSVCLGHLARFAAREQSAAVQAVNRTPTTNRSISIGDSGRIPRNSDVDIPGANAESADAAQSIQDKASAQVWLVIKT